jgi:hypothetical protein
MITGLNFPNTNLLYSSCPFISIIESQTLPSFVIQTISNIGLFIDQRSDYLTELYIVSQYKPVVNYTWLLLQVDWSEDLLSTSSLIKYLYNYIVNICLMDTLSDEVIPETYLMRLFQKRIWWGYSRNESCSLNYFNIYVFIRFR